MMLQSSFLLFDSWNLLSTFLITLLVQVLFFAYAAILKTDRVTDLAYGLTFALLAILLYWLVGEQDLRSSLMLGAVVFWGLRLAAYLFIRIHKMGRDVRFDGRRENFWRFASFWSLQAVAIWLIMLPTTVVASRANQVAPGSLEDLAKSLDAWLLVGMLSFSFGFIVETIADYQKFKFRNDPANKGRWMQSGLFKFSRYPNYFGEIVLWWGVYLAAIPVLDGWMHAVVLGPIFISVLLLKVSGIPLLEEGQQERYGHDPAYQFYREGTNLLIPGRPARAS